jgi:hypothetical protein
MQFIRTGAQPRSEPSYVNQGMVGLGQAAGSRRRVGGVDEALAERALEVELTDPLCYERHREPAGGNHPQRQLAEDACPRARQGRDRGDLPRDDRPDMSGPPDPRSGVRTRNWTTALLAIKIDFGDRMPDTTT